MVFRRDILFFMGLLGQLCKASSFYEFSFYKQAGCFLPYGNFEVSSCGTILIGLRKSIACDA